MSNLELRWKKWGARLAVTAVVWLGMASQATGAIIYLEDFDDGTADGFTLSGLWHVTGNFPESGTKALGYVQSETVGAVPDGDYAIGNVAATSFGPSIAIPSGSTTLTFDAFVGDEFDVQPGTFDQFSVWASLDGSTLNTILASSAPSAGGVGIPEWGGVAAYNTVNVDLSSFASSNIFLAYHFDSIDGAFNEYPGVRVDNIAVDNVNGNGGTPPIPEPASLLLFGFGGIGVALVRRRESA